MIRYKNILIDYTLLIGKNGMAAKFPRVFIPFMRRIVMANPNVPIERGISSRGNHGKKPKGIFRGRRRSGVHYVEPTRTDTYDPNDVFYIAVHEAGHAVACVVLGLDLKSVEVKRYPLPSGIESAGFTDSARVMASDLTGKGEKAAMPHLINIYAGPSAERMVNPRMHEYTGHHADLEDAERVAAYAICNLTVEGDRTGFTEAEMERNKPRLDALLELAKAAADRLVKDLSQTIFRVADLLKDRKELTGYEVAEIVKAKGAAGITHDLYAAD
jgi:hypothetical protein